MEFWPADFRTNVSAPPTQKKRKGKATYLNEHCLEPGSLGAATLTPGGWITAVQSRSEHTPRVVKKAAEVFPQTKLLPPTLPKLSVHQRAEQGARFLRTYHPDIDVPFELIKDEIQTEQEEALADFMLDPYSGNRLAQSSFVNKQRQKLHFLAFPSGITGSDLNIAPFHVTRDKQISLIPSATPTLTFDTPIQQIEAFLSKSDTIDNSSLLAVRVHSTVSVVRVQDDSTPQTDRPSLSGTSIVPINLKDSGGHRVVDVSGTLFASSDAQVLFVNDMGTVYNSKLEGGNKTTLIASNTRESESSQTDQFWRVLRRDEYNGMRCSSKKLQLFDLRAHAAPSSTLFDLKRDVEFLTSIENPLEGRHLMCLSTTRKLVWLDERNPKGPVLSVKHQRALDRSLHVETVLFGSSPYTVLSSAMNSLVTVYNIDYEPFGHVQEYGQPFVLTGSPSVTFPLAGSAFCRLSAEEESNFNLFQLSSTGSLWRTGIAFTDDSARNALDNLSEPSEWTADMHALAARTKIISEEIPPLGGREYLDANLRGAYEKIFHINKPTSTYPEIDPEAVYQTLEKMPFFWQDMDGLAEHMLLPFDVAFRCGLEPLHASRADFLTGSLLGSPQGYVALIRERVPIARLVSTVRWHHDIKSLPSLLVPDVAIRSQTLINHLHEEALAHAATAEGMKRAIESTQHLALDLALSRYVFAPQSFSTAKGRVTSGDLDDSKLDDSNLLSEATQAMSLGATEPPAVQFGYLHPITKVPYEEDEQMGPADEQNTPGVDLPLGVRLLLSQWEVGADPQTYVFTDHYDEPDIARERRRAAPAKRIDPSDGGQTHQPRTVPPVISARRVPPVVASTHRPLGTTVPPVRTASMFELGPGHTSNSFPDRPASSQDITRPPADIFSSQELGPSTQPLPGAFGGGSRQQKKIGKKRMGGF